MASTGSKGLEVIGLPSQLATLSSIDLQAWLTNALSGIANHKINRIDELLP